MSFLDGPLEDRVTFYPGQLLALVIFKFEELSEDKVPLRETYLRSYENDSLRMLADKKTKCPLLVHSFTYSLGMIDVLYLH